MNIFEWKEIYSVDIKSIDNEHQRLFQLINQLFGAMSHGKAKDILSETFAQLIDYTKTHFRREEMYFSSTNYPEYQEHKQQHELFIAKIGNLKKQFESGEQRISVELIKFLSDWLINHIQVSDKRYMVHLKKYGVS